MRALREAAWLTADRARAWARVLLVGSVLALVAGLLLQHDGVDPRGEPLGTDFASFWAAGRLALAGDPAAAYDPARHRAAQAAAFSGHDIGYYAFFYPPAFLMVCAPFAMLPYLPALAAWLRALAGRPAPNGDGCPCQPFPCCSSRRATGRTRS